MQSRSDVCSCECLSRINVRPTGKLRFRCRISGAELLYLVEVGGVGNIGGKLMPGMVVSAALKNRTYHGWTVTAPLLPGVNKLRFD